MASPQEQKYFDDCEEWFVFKGWGYDQIIQRLGELGGAVSKATLSAWNKKGNWNEKRAAFQKTRKGMVHQLHQAIEKLSAQLYSEDGEFTEASLSKLTKLINLVDKIDKGGPDLRTMSVEVLGHFSRHVRDNFPTDEVQSFKRQVTSFMKMLEVGA